MLVIGSVFFGFVIGWVTYRTIRRTATNGLSDIATVGGAVGGAWVTTLFPAKTEMFGGYCIGLAIGFLTYLFISWRIVSASVKNPELKAIDEWLGGNPTPSETARPVRPVPPG
jgi:NhaP-type Na+/H+ or K+/H+ antiporter